MTNETEKKHTEKDGKLQLACSKRLSQYLQQYYTEMTFFPYPPSRSRSILSESVIHIQ